MFEKELIVFSDTEYASKDAVIEGMAQLVADKVESVEGSAAWRWKPSAFSPPPGRTPSWPGAPCLASPTVRVP